MKVAEAGYEILVLLAISDKNYHKNEVRSIKQFLSVHFNGVLDTNIANSHREVMILSNEQRLQRLIKAAEYFKDNKSLKNNIRMANYALELILVDRKITDEERLRFKLLGEFWSIDLHRLINKKINKKNV